MSDTSQNTQSAAPVEPKTEKIETQVGGAKKVLIAEDEKAIANALKLKLQKSGFEAVVAEDGSKAVSELKTGEYDLLLLDILMPVADGWQVLSQIKEAGISLPIIVTSNLSQEEDVTKAKSLGAKDFLVKSNSTMDEIVEKVQENLG